MFGCACFPHLRPYYQYKMQFRSAECVYLGPSSQHKGYKCLASNGRIFISKDVLFIEFRFPYPDLFPPPPPMPISTSNTYPANIPLTNITPSTKPGLGTTSIPQPATTPSNPTPAPNSLPSPQPINNDAVPNILTESSIVPATPEQVQNAHPMHTRSKYGIFKPKHYLAHSEPRFVK